jgi:hypothetical protein
MKAIYKFLVEFGIQSSYFFVKASSLDDAKQAARIQCPHASNVIFVGFGKGSVFDIEV